MCIVYFHFTWLENYSLIYNADTCEGCSIYSSPLVVTRYSNGSGVLWHIHIMERVIINYVRVIGFDFAIANLCQKKKYCVPLL